MLQTILVYVLLTIIMISLSLRIRKTDRDIRKTFFYIIAIVFCYSIIFGVRYGVGTDYFGYLGIYQKIQSTISFSEERMEAGFTLIMTLFAKSGLHYSFFFGTIAFLQLALILVSLKNQPKVIPWVVFTFMVGCTWLTYSNGLRQQLAFCIIVFALQNIINRQPLKFYSLLLVAISMHKSAILMLPIYPLFCNKKTWFNNITLQYSLLVISLILMNINILQEAFQRMGQIAALLGYEKYMGILDVGKEHLLDSLSRQRGIGFFALLLIDIILISQSNRAKTYFQTPLFSIMYDLYFIGVIWLYTFNGSIVFGRPNYYLIGYKYIIAGFILYFLYNNKSKGSVDGIISKLLVGSYLLVFIGAIYRMEINTSQYIFYWQDNLYNLKQYIFR